MHLLLTDVVMPDRGGRELAALVRVRSPSTRIVFMSGYPDQEAGADGPDWGDALFLPKPFDRARLLATVRNALDLLPAQPESFAARSDQPGTLAN